MWTYMSFERTPDRGVRDVTRSVVAVARQRGISLMAAGLAFYLFNALVPLVLFVILGASAFGWMEQAVALVDRAIDVDAQRFVSAMEAVIGEGTGRGRAFLIAVGILSWSAFTSFQSVNMAFGFVYGSRQQGSSLRMVANSLLSLGVVVVAVLVLAGVGVTLAVVTDDVVVRLVSVPLLFVALLAIFLPMYLRFPSKVTTLREALPGAVLAAFAWTVCAVGFRLYVVTAESVELYGVAGGVMLVLTWLYVGCLAVLVGVVLNAVLAGRVDVDDKWTLDEVAEGTPLEG